MRIIGDVHGLYDQYKTIAQASPSGYSIQLGDFGFDYSTLDNLNSKEVKHFVFGGNHDNYDDYYDVSGTLGDFGLREIDDFEFFMVRGSISIDCLKRVQNYIASNHKTWWYEEELTNNELEEAINQYEKNKPNIVLSHDCPASIKGELSSPYIMKMFGWPENFTCRTQQTLQIMLDIHRPSLWIFGHFHQSWMKIISGTEFICLAQLESLDIINGEDDVL